MDNINYDNDGVGKFNSLQFWIERSWLLKKIQDFETLKGQTCEIKYILLPIQCFSRF